MSFQILGMGTAVPCELVTQADAAELAMRMTAAGNYRMAMIPLLYAKAGVRTRHCVVLDSSTNGAPAEQTFYPAARVEGDRGPSTGERMRRYEHDALEVAVRAASGALEDAAKSAADISHLVTVSCSGFAAPGVDIGLIDRLGLSRGVTRTHVGFMGCHGALNGLRVSRALAEADPGSCVLLCCVELCSLHHQYTSDVQQIVANALFSDGAGAVVGAATTSASNDESWQVIDQQTYLVPDSRELMSWRIFDHGFQMTLSPRVPEAIRESLRPWLSGWLNRQSLEIADIRSWAIHPGGPKILVACGNAIELDDAMMSPSRQVLAEFGNMSSPTVLFILDRIRRQADSRPCVMLAFGPGMTIEAALIR
jgi:predicted naringenin-chalcone synthase